MRESNQVDKINPRSTSLMFDVVKTIFLALSFAIVAAAEKNQAQAYENFNECELFLSQVIEKRSQYSLDEPHLIQEEMFGFFVVTYDDALREIVSVHQDLSDELWDKYEANLNNRVIETINGLVAEELSDEEFDKEFQQDSIEITVKGIEQSLQLNKKFYESIVVEDLVLDLRDVSRINTKDYQFDANFISQTTWKDERYLEFAHDIYKRASKFTGSDGGFFCKLPEDFFVNNNLFFPRLEPRRFMTSRDEIFTRIEFHYAPTNYDYCSDESYFSNCTTKEKEQGIAYFELYRDYQGTINDEFFVHKFPFDTQSLRITFEPDRVANQFAHIELQETWYVDEYLDRAVNNLTNPEWKFTDARIMASVDLDPASDDFVPIRNFDFEIERRSSYYVYKLMLPIIFLLLLSWSVFFINIQSLESRLTISVISFLSLIAYNFVVDDDLPKLGYLTFIDKFVLLSYVFAGLPTIQTVIVEYVSNRYRFSFTNSLDTLFRKYFLVGYIGFLMALLHFSDVFN